MILGEFCKRKFLSEGENAKCYLIGKDRNKVLKIFKKPLKREEVEKFKYLLEYQNESFLFPFEFIHDDKFLYGYIMNKAKGEELKKVFYSSDLTSLANHSIKLENDIDFISKGKIIIHDFSSRNIIYDGNLLQAIDPDFYKINHELAEEEVKKVNINTYKSSVSNLFILPFLEMNHTDRYVIDKINNYRKCDIKVSDFIIELKNDLEKYYKQEITKLDDLTKILKR